MTSAELTEWMAYERTFGPILLHERIDVGFAQLGWLMARLWGSTKRKLTRRDFMPDWYQYPTIEDAVKQGFEEMLKLAESNANNQ
jgi:hypothetical protein